MTGPTIVVIDDKEPFRRILKAVAAATGCTMVGEAEGPAEAIAVLEAMDRPDLVLLDINLGSASGIDLARQLATADPLLRIVLVSTMEARDLPTDVRTAGAIGFVEKSKLGPELVLQLAQASSCEDFWPSDLA